jgi:hypothetical protein
MREPKIKKKGATIDEIVERVYSFGINPTNGGRPPKERSIKIRSITIEGLEFIVEDRVFTEIKLKNQK